MSTLPLTIPSTTDIAQGRTMLFPGLVGFFFVFRVFIAAR